ncbi:aromatic-preferring amino acid transporter isoform X3 [Mus musculus]|uniref:aromatic-preferring amino acid transporter isoform X3 n=1 Tax=Mus musculus TaxID=10090 RepID=UPI0003D6E813|nr:aromatic-preferring amino acid transporter isoform X3 [Mus musculus]|eukprot:XP_006515181.1 PREDICTED: aromatic-preferring amino acid transporter isoform X3 [Mus musculus]
MERSEEKDGSNKPAGQEQGSGTAGLMLKREIGLWSAVSMTAGCMIGSGIFMSPQGVLVYIGSPGASLIVWATCGLLAMLGALCYAELGSLVPESGGDYAYILRTFGSLPAFLVIYVYVLVGRPAGITAVSLSFAEYVLAPFYPGCSSLPQVIVKIVASSCILLLLLINFWSSRMSTVLMNVCTTAKVFSLLVIVVGGAVVLMQGHASTESLLFAFHNTTQQAGRIGMAFYQGLWSFDGWSNINTVIEELKNPKGPSSGVLGLAGALGCCSFNIWHCQWGVLQRQPRVLCSCERRSHAAAYVHDSRESTDTSPSPDLHHGCGFTAGHPGKLQHLCEPLKLPVLAHLWNYLCLSSVFANKDKESPPHLQGSHLHPCHHAPGVSLPGVGTHH